MKEKIVKIFFSIILILIIVILSNIDAYALENTNEVDTTIWGYAVVYDGHTVYVKDENNSIQWSVPVEKDICWIRGEYLYSQTWYALDNSKGIYEDGSMFWVRMIFIDSPDYNFYKERLDDDFSTNQNNSENEIIIFGVTKPDGTIIELDRDSEFLKDADLYIQIGNFWDKEKINNYLEEMDIKNIGYINLDKDNVKGFFAKISNSSSDIGTAFGEGNIYIICGIAGAFVIVCVCAFIFIKKKNNKNVSKDTKTIKEKK